MNKAKLKNKVSQRRARRTRQSVGVSDRPRLSVFRSNRFIYAQIINDKEQKTLWSANSKTEGGKAVKTEAAKKVGEKVAKLAKEGGVTKVVFDRGRYRYHGRIKALAEGAREAGLDF